MADDRPRRVRRRACRAERDARPSRTQLFAPREERTSRHRRPGERLLLPGRGAVKRNCWLSIDASDGGGSLGVRPTSEFEGGCREKCCPGRLIVLC
jgi:hypothetical protein